jgi:hypothetical protein
VPSNAGRPPVRCATRQNTTLKHPARLLNHPWEMGWLFDFAMSLIILVTERSTLRQ